MAWFDLPREQLQTHRTATVPPPDLDAFWAGQLALAAERAGPTSLVEYQPGLFAGLDVYDVTFTGGLGHPIRGWFLRPRSFSGAVVVKYIGYGGGRGMPHEHLFWPSVGYAVFVMDTRGQGALWSVGETGDPVEPGFGGPEVPGVMTRGVLDPATYYYTRLWVDAARAVDVAAGLDGVDPARVGVTGGSQGGALTIAAAALNPRVAWAAAEIPFLCDVARAITITDASPYAELVSFLARHTDRVERVLRTLAYVDGAVLASRIAAPILFTTGLMDATCPPSTVFAAYNAVPGEKEIDVFEFMGHETSPHFPPRLAEHARGVLGA